jgi:hypothetical protein
MPTKITVNSTPIVITTDMLLSLCSVLGVTMEIGGEPELNMPIAGVGPHEVVDFTDNSTPFKGTFDQCMLYINQKDLTVFKLVNGTQRFGVRPTTLDSPCTFWANPLGRIFTAEDSKIASSEGWDVFDEDGVYGIEKDDGEGVFENDAEAFMHVVRSAAQGNMTAIRGLIADGRTTENVDGLADSFVKLLVDERSVGIDQKAGTPHLQIASIICAKGESLLGENGVDEAVANEMASEILKLMRDVACGRAATHCR